MLTLTKKFSELPDIVFWDDIVVFLKEAFQGYRIKESLTSNKYFRVYSDTGGSFLEFAPAEDDKHLPMHWECDCWRLEMYVDPDTGQIHTDTTWEWCMNNLPRKKRVEEVEPEPTFARFHPQPQGNPKDADILRMHQTLREMKERQEEESKDPYEGDPDPWNR